MRTQRAGYEHRETARAEYLRLRGEGLRQKDAAQRVGINRRTGYEWDRQLRAASPSDVHTPPGPKQYKDQVTSRFALPLTAESVQDSQPDPGLEPVLSVVPEPEGLSGMPVQDAQLRARIGTAPVAAAVAALPSLEQVEKSIDPRFLSLGERVLIADLLLAGASRRAIARQLGRSPSSISREINRNSHPRLGYQPYGAQRKATAARARPKTGKLAEPSKLRSFVQCKLLKRWSPEQICASLVVQFPEDPRMRVSHETIYQALYVQAQGGLKREVQEALRTGRARRKSRKNPEQRRSRFRDPMVNISERPAEVQDRAVPGHWEGDLITGTLNKSAIGTLVERNTRYVMLVHLPVEHSAASVRDGLIQTMGQLPEQLRKSLTWDQGVEMAKHLAFSTATDMDVYFCDPHSPWQRGSNENTNGLLRQYFPKGTDLSVYTAEDLARVSAELNERPRKTLGWDTPVERIRDLLLAS